MKGKNVPLVKMYSEETLHDAVLAERERCAKIADKWAKDHTQSSECRLVAAYIRQGIRSGK